MSLVNDALRKVRDEESGGRSASVPGHGGVAKLEAMLRVAPATGRRRKSNATGRWAGLIVLALAGVSAAAWWLGSPAVSPALADARVPVAVRDGSRVTGHGSRVENPPARPETRDPRPVTAARVTEPLATAAVKLPDVAGLVDFHVPTPAPAAALVPEPAVEPVTVAVEPAPRPAVLARSNPVDNVPGLADQQVFIQTVDIEGLPRLRLDAIGWSPRTPAAVINKSIVRPGREVAPGVVLVEIKPDEVVLRAGDKTFYLRVP